MARFHAVTCFFNPCGFKSLLRNYFAFSSELRRQGVPLLTVECAFGDGDYQIPESEVRVRSQSIMWQKERLLNHAMNFLPDDCDYVAFLDCDVLFSHDDWHEKTVDVLQGCDVAQTFQRVGHLAKGEVRWDGNVVEDRHPGVAFQATTNQNWLWKRRRRELPWAHPGFGWAFRREFLHDLGLYERSICGGGDTIFVNCILDCFYIHDFAKKHNQKLIADVMKYCKKLREKKPVLGYVPVEIGHLYHGSLESRNYFRRSAIYSIFDFDPEVDIAIGDGAWEWATPKNQMHELLKTYFTCRNEDM